MSALRDWSPGFLYEIQPPPFPMRKLRVYFPTAQEIQWKSRSRIDSEVSTVVPAHEFPGLVLYPVQSKTPSLVFPIATSSWLPFSFFFSFPGFTLSDFSSFFLYIHCFNKLLTVFDPGHTELNQILSLLQGTMSRTTLL